VAIERFSVTELYSSLFELFHLIFYEVDDKHSTQLFNSRRWL